MQVSTSKTHQNVLYTCITSGRLIANCSLYRVQQNRSL